MGCTVLDVNRVLGQRIRAARLKQFTQQELGRLLGVSKTTVSKWESGTRQPTIDRLLLLSKVLNRPITYFIPDALCECDSQFPTQEIPVYVLRRGAFSRDQPNSQLWDELELEKVTYALRVADEELKQAGYQPGDILLVQPSGDLYDEDLALIREEITPYQHVIHSDAPMDPTSSESQRQSRFTIIGFFRSAVHTRRHHD